MLLFDYGLYTQFVGVDILRQREIPVLKKIIQKEKTKLNKQDQQNGLNCNAKNPIVKTKMVYVPYYFVTASMYKFSDFKLDWIT